MVCLIFLLLGGQIAAGRSQSTGDVLSSEKPGIDRPGARADHRQRAAKDRQNNCHRTIADARQGDPQLHDRDERSHSWCP
jgi:hypothetical protein